MSILGEHFADGAHVRPNGFYRARPQVLRAVLETLGRALARTLRIVGDARLTEPRFTRQLLVDFERARDETPGSPRYDITHQPELPIANESGQVTTLRRLDFRLVFLRQVGRTGDYLCLEVKYLDTADRNTDREYVNEGVDRIVIGDYARGHPWAIMVGLERSGPLDRTADHVGTRLVLRYGADIAYRASSRIGLPHTYESEHAQAGGPHQITILHAYHMLQPAS